MRFWAILCFPVINRVVHVCQPVNSTPQGRKGQEERKRERTHLYIRIQHFPRPLPLRDLWRRDDLDDGLERTRAQGEPLAEDELQGVARVFGAEVSGRDGEGEGCYYFRDFVWVPIVVNIAKNNEKTF